MAARHLTPVRLATVAVLLGMSLAPLGSLIAWLIERQAGPVHRLTIDGITVIGLSILLAIAGVAFLRELNRPNGRWLVAGLGLLAMPLAVFQLGSRLIVLALFLTGGSPPVRALRWLDGVHGVAISAAWLVVVSLMIYAIFRRAQRRTPDPDGSTCLACGYDLRGQNAASPYTCPECGAYRTVSDRPASRVGPVQARQLPPMGPAAAPSDDQDRDQPRT